MMPTNDDITKNKTLTSKERADIQQFFIVIVNEMKKHGVPDIGLIKRAFEMALEKHGDTRRKTGEPYIFPCCPHTVFDTIHSIAYRFHVPLDQAYAYRCFSQILWKYPNPGIPQRQPLH